ncbi:MAG: DUF4062 domain-containing protein [Oceanospirillaceae bacterium]|nr:DUF4062 domain-containing protein [Oceanospirillaceae bacterium]
MDKRYQVFVSSTYIDLQEERQAVHKTILDINCIPAGMELFPAVDIEQFEFIKRIIDDCDYYLVIIGARYGSLSSEGISYTEMEYEYAVSKGIKVIALLHGNIDDLPASKHERTEAAQQKLVNFRNKVKTGRVVDFWNDSAELPGKVAISLMQAQRLFPAIGWIRADQASSQETLEKIEKLREENHILKEKLSKSMNNLTTKKLAQGDETILLSGSTDAASSYEDFHSQEWSDEYSWNEIIKCIGQIILSPTHKSSVESDLATNLREDAQADFSPDSWGSIQIQLMALNIMEFTNDDSNFLKLTDHGKSTLLELLSIKSSL